MIMLGPIFVCYVEDSDHVISDDSGLDFHTGDANW